MLNSTGLPRKVNVDTDEGPHKNLTRCLTINLHLTFSILYISISVPTTRLLMSHLYAIVPILQHIVNLCLTTGDFPISCKSSIVIPLIKKPGLDREMLKNYRPVSNLSFLSKVFEKVISISILGHILDNNIVDRDSFQSAYRAGHSCETALLRVYNDIVTTVGKGNGSFLVLLYPLLLTRLTMIIYSTYSRNMSELAVVHYG